MKLMICGHGRHGKDTVAELLTEYVGLTFESSSRFLAQKMFDDSTSKLYDKYSTVVEMYEDRANHREDWFNWIADYNKDDATRFTRDLFTQYDMYVGIRNDREFFAAQNAELFDLSIWVDATKRKPLEGEGSNKIKPEYCDIIIDNNSGLKDLEFKVRRLSKFLRQCQTFELMMETVQIACKGGKCGR